MPWLPTDLVSFVWGVLVAAATVFASGFVKKLGEDGYAWVKRKVNPPEPAPTRVEAAFKPTTYAEEDCAWVYEEKLYKYEDENYSYYPHPRTGGKVFRTASPGPPPRSQYLLVKPNAKRQSHA